MSKFSAAIATGLLIGVFAQAHDPWIQPHANIARVGDNVHLDLLLGNHGNDHRDFKLAGKVSPARGSFEVIGPNGKRLDWRDRLMDVGYTPKEGYWTTRFAGSEPGLYTAAFLGDQVVSYAPKRSIQSAKAFFILSKSLDNVPRDTAGFDRPLGHPLELVPMVNPVAPMGPGQELKVRLLFKGKPLAGARVSFIPQGEALTEKLDSRYERTTSEDGSAVFAPKEGNYYLIVAHRDEPNESGKGYDSTKYSTTLCVLVPQVCPCCGE